MNLLLLTKNQNSTGNKTRQAMYVLCNTEARSCNHCFSGKQWVLHNLSVWICSLRYPARNAHAPYCHLWPAPLYNIFPHYNISGKIFEKKSYWTQNVCSDYIYNFCVKHLILRRNERNMIKNVYRSSCKVPFILV